MYVPEFKNLLKDVEKRANKYGENRRKQKLSSSYVMFIQPSAVADMKYINEAKKQLNKKQSCKKAPKSGDPVTLKKKNIKLL